ncbi:protein fem-1 homolog CG6966-like isoform X1 [Octopus sinensis]|uniref:Protein fem-1 homolog CG6966-like isoform X1 n=1 Tax=Octopus sinensis TaxID=2607531 RepID=A0A7E6FSJ2_9MOLL|nr:protein fem-1 homolog CG6966-like isoform X1 [Octopus sinensis]
MNITYPALQDSVCSSHLLSGRKFDVSKLSGRRKIASLLTEFIRQNNVSKVKNTLNIYNVKQRYMIVSLKINGCPLIFTASHAGNVSLVNYFLDQCDANIEQRGTYVGMKSTPLWIAALRNHFYVVVALVEHGADINTQASSGKSAVSISCRNAKIVKYLIQQGADIDLPDARGRTSLMYSAPHLNICRRLLSLGANVNRVDHKGQDALHFAIKRGQLKTVDLFVRHGTNLLMKDNNGTTPLEFAAIHNKPDILEYLISTNQYGREAIISAYELLGSQFAMDYHLTYNAEQVKIWWFRAIEMRHGDTTQAPIMKHLSTNQRLVTNLIGEEFTSSDFLNQILHDVNSMWTQGLLVQSRILGPRHPTVIKSFMRKACFHINRTDFHSSLHLLYCLLSFFEQFTDPLQNDILDVVGTFSSILMHTVLANNSSTYYIFRIFHCFVKYVSYHIIPYLKKYGRNLMFHRIPDFERFLVEILDLLEFILNFPLPDCQGSEIENSLGELLRHHPRGMNHITLLQLSIRMYRTVSVVEMLLRCGADVNAVDNEGNTAIHYAILYPSQHQIEILSSLLQYGCHVDIVNNNGYSALEYLQHCRLITSYLKYCTLQCICARTIREHNVKYKHILSKDLAYFVDKHG